VSIPRACGFICMVPMGPAPIDNFFRSQKCVLLGENVFFSIPICSITSQTRF
jgi:hypothetical protein